MKRGMFSLLNNVIYYKDLLADIEKKYGGSNCLTSEDAKREKILDRWWLKEWRETKSNEQK